MQKGILLSEGNVKFVVLPKTSSEGQGIKILKLGVERLPSNLETAFSLIWFTAFVPAHLPVSVFPEQYFPKQFSAVMKRFCICPSTWHSLVTFGC